MKLHRDSWVDEWFRKNTRPEGLHPCDVAEIEHNRRALTLDARKIALNAARWFFLDRSEDAAPEAMLSVAAKFEAYLTAPERVMDDSLNTR